jgi:hypothetical protein
MKTTIEKILAAHGILEAFNANEDYSVKIENKPYLDLCIEKHGSQVTITHYLEQNGDLLIQTWNSTRSRSPSGDRRRILLES